jgi:hypothetical protein
MRKPILCAWIVLVGALFATGAFAALQIDANFDSGSIGSYTIDDANSTISLTLRTETLVNTSDQYTYWTHFKVSDAVNRPVTFRITNASLVTFLKTTTHEAQMVYSCDGENWGRITNHSYSGGTYTFSETFTCNEPLIATFFPFSHARMSQFVNSVSAGPGVQKTVLGTSEQGRDIDLLTITNPLVPLQSKKVIYIIGRQHAAETSSSHMLEGMINFLISGDVNACGLRSYYVWHIVPMLNPDGVYLGNTRATSESRDPNRDWNDPNTNSAGTDIVRAHANAVSAATGIDLFMDWHSQIDDQSWYNFIYAPSGNAIYPHVSAWTDFDSQNTSGTSCSTLSCSARGYATLRMGVPMLGLEPTPHLVTWTVESLKAQGVNLAFAINDYFGLYKGASLPSLASELGRSDCTSSCAGDADGDRDVDGSDIAALVAVMAQTVCGQ